MPERTVTCPACQRTVPESTAIAERWIWRSQVVPARPRGVETRYWWLCSLGCEIGLVWRLQQEAAA